MRRQDRGSVIWVIDENNSSVSFWLANKKMDFIYQNERVTGYTKILSIRKNRWGKYWV